MYACFCRHIVTSYHFWLSLSIVVAPPTFLRRPACSGTNSVSTCPKNHGCRIMQEDNHADHPSDGNIYRQDWLWLKMIDTFLFGSIGTGTPVFSCGWLVTGRPTLHTFVRKTDAENPPAVACVKVWNSSFEESSHLAEWIPVVYGESQLPNQPNRGWFHKVTEMWCPPVGAWLSLQGCDNVINRGGL